MRQGDIFMGKGKNMTLLYDPSSFKLNDKKSVMCPNCGKFLARVKPDDDKLHKIACKHCRKWIWFRAKSRQFGVEEIPPRTQASGKRFY